MRYDPFAVNGGVLNGFTRSRLAYAFAETELGFESTRSVGSHVRYASSDDSYSLSTSLSGVVTRYVEGSTTFSLTAEGTITVTMFGQGSEQIEVGASAVAVATRYFFGEGEVTFASEGNSFVTAAMTAFSTTYFTATGRMSVTTQGETDLAQTDVSATNSGSIFVETGYDHIDQVNGGVLNGQSRSYRQYLFAESDYGIETQYANFGIATWGYLDPAEFTISEEATGVRFVLPWSSINLDHSTSEDSRITRYMRGDHWFGFKDILTEPEVLVSAGQMEDGFSFNTIGQPLEFVYFSQFNVSSEVTGTRKVFGRSSSTFGFTQENTERVIRRVRSVTSTVFTAIAEPAINGVHESSAIATIDFFTANDSALVRSNSLGDADIRVFSDADDAKVNVRHAARGVSHIDISSEGSIFVNSMVQASSSFDISSSSMLGIRTRLFSGAAVFAFNTRQMNAVVRRKAFSNAVIQLASEGDGVRYAQFAVDSLITLTPTARPRRIVSDSVYMQIVLSSLRAQGLSNLSESASEQRTFTVDIREYEFVVPEEDRRFEV